MVHAFAERLDEGLLARPAIEEPDQPVAPIETQVGLVLAAREKVRRDVVGIADSIDAGRTSSRAASSSRRRARAAMKRLRSRSNAKCAARCRSSFESNAADVRSASDVTSSRVATTSIALSAKHVPIPD
jgi:hypothetical protein